MEHSSHSPTAIEVGAAEMPRPGWFGKMKQSKYLYYAFVIMVTASAIVLMVVPSEVLTAPEDNPELDLDTTFGTLVRFLVVRERVCMCREMREREREHAHKNALK